MLGCSEMLDARNTIYYATKYNGSGKAASTLFFESRALNADAAYEMR